MDVIESKVNTSETGFREIAEQMRSMVADLRERVERVKQGGGAAAVEKHRHRGKLLFRDGIERLLDPDTGMVLALAIAASLNAPLPERRVSIFRM